MRPITCPFNNNWRYKFGDVPKVKPPALPPAVTTPTEISAQAAGQAEKGLLRTRRGRESTILTPSFLKPVKTIRPELRTTLG